VRKAFLHKHVQQLGRVNHPINVRKNSKNAGGGYQGVLNLSGWKVTGEKKGDRRAAGR